MKKEKDILKESLLAHLPEDFFGQFKTMGELNNFMDTLFKRGVEHMLKSELSDRLHILLNQVKTEWILVN